MCQKGKAIVVIVHLVQRCDSDMDFEALLIHTRQEVALDLKSFMISIFQSLNILKDIGVFLHQPFDH